MRAVRERFMKLALETLRVGTDCDHAAVRTPLLGDFVFETALGHSKEFIDSEQSLLVEGPGGELVERGGKPRLACLCGSVLERRADLAGTLSASGSYVRSSKQELGELPDQVYAYRTTCDDFERLALIPLVDDAGHRLGLLHLASELDVPFTDDSLARAERLAHVLGRFIEALDADTQQYLRKWGPRTTVLVVDDSSAIRRLLKHYFERSAVCVLQAADGQEALELLETERVDLIIADLDMPRVGGDDLVRQLVSRWQHFAPRTILMSGHVDRGRRVSAELEIPYLEKPFTLMSLHDVLDQAMAS